MQTMPAKKKKKVTMYDIARECGVSGAVVSKVINNAGGNIRISEAIREKVLETAKRMNYHKNFSASALSERSSRTLGVYLWPRFVDADFHSFQPDIIHGIEEVCIERNFRVLIENLTGKLPVSDCLADILQSRIDGLIWVQHSQENTALREMSENTDSLTVVGIGDMPAKVPLIQFDNRGCIETCLEHLQSLGHKRIGFIGTLLEDRSANIETYEREDLFLELAKARGLEVDLETVTSANRLPAIPFDPCFCEHEGEAGMRHLLSLPEERQPTALVCYNDAVAASAMRVAQNAGKRIPDDLSILGIDNSIVAPVTNPALTSVNQPLREMGRKAAEILFDIIDATKAGKKFQAAETNPILMKPELVVRQSTGPCPG